MSISGTLTNGKLWGISVFNAEGTIMEKNKMLFIVKVTRNAEQLVSSLSASHDFQSRVCVFISFYWQKQKWNLFSFSPCFSLRSIWYAPTQCHSGFLLMVFKELDQCCFVWVLYVHNNLHLCISYIGGCPCGVMVNVMDCEIVVSEFVLQSHYHVHFQANTRGKGMNPLILPAMGQIVPLLFFSENGFGIK